MRLCSICTEEAQSRSTGEFSALVKSHYKDKIAVTAVDPSDAVLSADKDSGVDYRQGTIMDIEGLFDVCLFAKSLHHCDPLPAVSTLHGKDETRLHAFFRPWKRHTPCLTLMAYVLPRKSTGVAWKPAPRPG